MIFLRCFPFFPWLGDVMVRLHILFDLATFVGGHRDVLLGKVLDSISVELYPFDGPCIAEKEGELPLGSVWRHIDKEQRPSPGQRICSLGRCLFVDARVDRMGRGFVVPDVEDGEAGYRKWLWAGGSHASARFRTCDREPNSLINHSPHRCGPRTESTPYPNAHHRECK